MDTGCLAACRRQPVFAMFTLGSDQKINFSYSYRVRKLKVYRKVNMQRYNSASEYYKTRFGKKMFKLAVDGGFTCPNRDGTKGIGGCIFCSKQGSGDFAAKGNDIASQLTEAKAKIMHKVAGEAGYICYFQSYTNTYAPVEKLRRLFTEAISFDFVDALSVATRPDCVNSENAALLGELAKVKPVFAELGLQTSNEKTAEYINRCYPNEDFTKAVRLLRLNGVEVTAHVIIGLPKENEVDCINTIEFLNKHDIQGVKLQLLHVLKGTALAETDVRVLDMEEYFNILGRCINHLRDDIVVHRLTGDGAKKDLIAPLWSANKHAVLNGFSHYMKVNDIVQGKECINKRVNM